MPLGRIRISTFRCLRDVELELHPRRNYIFGPNGAGKTSLLEAVFVLGRGRSFRTRQMRRLVQHGSDGFAGIRRSACGASDAPPWGRVSGRAAGEEDRWRAGDGHGRASGAVARSTRSTRACTRSSRAGPASGGASSTGACSTWNLDTSTPGRRYRRALEPAECRAEARRDAIRAPTVVAALWPRLVPSSMKAGGGIWSGWPRSSATSAAVCSTAL